MKGFSSFLHGFSLPNAIDFELLLQFLLIPVLTQLRPICHHEDELLHLLPDYFYLYNGNLPHQLLKHQGLLRLQYSQ